MTAPSAPLSLSISYPPYQHDLLLAESGLRNACIQFKNASKMLGHEKHITSRYESLQEAFRMALRIRHPDKEIMERVFQILHVQTFTSFTVLDIKPLTEERFEVMLEQYLPRISESAQTELVALKTLAKIRLEQPQTERL